MTKYGGLINFSRGSPEKTDLRYTKVYYYIMKVEEFHMKKIIGFMALMISTLFVLGACSSNEKRSSSKKDFSVILLIPGNLGDKSFFDSANNGLKQVKSDLKVKTKVIEMGTDETKWEPNFVDAAEENWDLIISGNAASDLMNDIATKYPDKKFMNFDNSGDKFEKNVYSVAYGTNEASFLAGAMAGLATRSKMAYTNPEQNIGFLGGMDIPGINDFLVGYIQGALKTNPDVKVTVSYAGSFTDPAKGKELGLVQYDSGVDISFNVAGQTGLGLIDAALAKDKYAIGVDTDQALLYKDSEPKKAEHILTSVVKNINITVFNAVKEAKEGSLKFGQHQLLGLKEKAVGLAKNDYYKTLPDDIKTEIDKLEKEISDGNIKVKSGFKMSADEMTSYRNSVKP